VLSFECGIELLQPPLAVDSLDQLMNDLVMRTTLNQSAEIFVQLLIDK
jgi:hypothetical protein